jgi:CheY-like chemotaxis protein
MMMASATFSSLLKGKGSSQQLGMARALKTVRSEDPDLMLLDIIMPGMDG